MGGPHASVDQNIFLDSGHFDYVLKGEAEETLPQLHPGPSRAATTRP